MGISINFEWFNIRQNSTNTKIGKPRKLYRNTKKSEAGSNEPITMLNTSFLKNDIQMSVAISFHSIPVFPKIEEWKEIADLGGKTNIKKFSFCNEVGLGICFIWEI